MRAKTLQIVWHTKEPVLTAAFHPDGYLATGGADKDIKLWTVSQDADAPPSVTYLTSLSGHAKAINCLRFSPSGSCLVSAGDSGEVLMWKPSLDPATGGPLGGSPDKQTAATSTDASTPAVPNWKACHTLRGHHEDVLDIAWSPDGSAVATVGVDNECMLFDVEAHRAVSRLTGHRHFVQGVTWDPLGAYLVTQSADRTCRIHGRKPAAAGKKASAAAAAAAAAAPAAATIKDLIFLQSITKRQLPTPPPAAADPNNAADEPAAAATTAAAVQGTSPAAKPKSHYQAQHHCLFQDEGLATFFRRLAWSPDGTLLVTPAGCYKRDADAPVTNAAYVFARGSWNAPLLQLPTPGSPPLVVRFCPVFFELEQSQQPAQQPGTAAAAAPSLSSILRLPYKLVFAVATADTVLLYHTQSLAPFALLGSLHFANITDLAWAPDGSALLITSSDGFCSLATFGPGELGRPLVADELPPALQAALQRASISAPAAAAKVGGAGKQGKAAGAAIAAAGGPSGAASPSPAAVAGASPMAAGRPIGAPVVAAAAVAQTAAAATAAPQPSAAAAVATAAAVSPAAKQSRPAESPGAGVAPPRKRICPMPVGDPVAAGAGGGSAASVVVPAATTLPPATTPAAAATAAAAVVGGELSRGAPAAAAATAGSGGGAAPVQPAPVKRITPQPMGAAAAGPAAPPGVAPAATATAAAAARPVRHIRPTPMDPAAPAAASPAAAAGPLAPITAAPAPATAAAAPAVAGSSSVAGVVGAAGGAGSSSGMSMAKLALQAGLAAAKRAAGAAAPPRQP